MLTRTLKTALARLRTDAEQRLRPYLPQGVSSDVDVVACTRPTRESDGTFDGCILAHDGVHAPTADVWQVAPILPQKGAAHGTVILVNGVMTDLSTQREHLQVVADYFSARAIGIHNATFGMAADLLECVLNKLRAGDTPAIDTVTRVLAMGLEQQQPITIVGHSQGALIVARALQNIQAVLEETGFSPDNIKQTLASITVHTYGGAAARYVDGPRYIHWVNRADVVALFAGVGLDCINPFGHMGEGAEVRDFFEVNRDTALPKLGTWALKTATFIAQACHSPTHIYMNSRRKASTTPQPTDS